MRAVPATLTAVAVSAVAGTAALQAKHQFDQPVSSPAPAAEFTPKASPVPVFGLGTPATRQVGTGSGGSVQEVSGEITNSTDTAHGAVIQAVFYDGSGKELARQEGYVADIPAHATKTYSLTAASVPLFRSVAVNVITVL